MYFTTSLQKVKLISYRFILNPVAVNSENYTSQLMKINLLVETKVYFLKTNVSRLKRMCFHCTTDEFTPWFPFA